MIETPIDYSRKWLVMAAVSMGVFLATIDGSIVNIALPTLVRSLQTELSVVQWVVLAYLLTVTTLMLSVGRLADIAGKKPIYNTGFIIFTVGSALCSFAPGVYWLIAFRVVQAVGAAMVTGLGMAIVTEAFPPTERGKALGITGAMVSIGIVTGPTLGGLLISLFSWRSIFYVNLPIGVVGTLMVMRFVPDIKPTKREDFDYWGAITIFISLISLLLALTLGQQNGYNQPVVWLLLGMWVAFLALFIIVEQKISQPVINLSLFKNDLFSINLSTGFITFLASSSSVFLLPFYLENVLGFDTRHVGLLLAVTPVLLAVTAPLSGTLSDRFGTRPISAVGLVLLAIGYIALSTLDQSTTVWGYIWRMVPGGIGMGMFQSPNNSAVMGAVPRSRLGIASGLLANSRSLGQTIGVALGGAFWAARAVAHAGQPLPGGATTALPAVQVLALRDVYWAISGLVLAGLLLSLWGLVRERRRKNLAG